MTSPFIRGFRATPESLVALIQSITDPPSDDEAATLDLLGSLGYFDPTEDEIDAWMIGMMDDASDAPICTHPGKPHAAWGTEPRTWRDRIGEGAS